MAQNDPTPGVGAPSASPRQAVPEARCESTATTGIAHEAIARRAYEIHLSGEGRSEIDNWLRAEGELRESR